MIDTEDTTDLADEVTAAYVAAALWSTMDDDGAEALDATHDASDLADDTMRDMRAAVVDFLALVDREGIDWRDGWTPAEFGHDFWLTRNGHGAGFWDRFYAGPSASADTVRRAVMGDRLADLACAAGSSDIYVGDDGALYVS